MYKKIVSIILVVGLVFTGGYFTAKMLVPDSSQVSNEPRYATKEVTRGDIKQGVNITGQLNGNWGGSISAPKPEGITDASGMSISVTYKVEELFVDANQMIKKGDNLVRLSAENLGEILDDLTQSIQDKQSSISEKTIALGKIINKDITDVSQVNPNEGIVITAPIRGRVSALSITEGDMLESGLLATIVDDSVVKIPFKVNQHEFENLKVGEEVQMQISRIVKGATENEDKEVPLFNGFITGKITSLSENAVPSTDMIYYVHNGMIEAANPGLVQPGMKALIYKQENGTPLYSLNFTSTVASYLNEKKVYYTGSLDTTVIATEVLVSENEFVEEGQTLIRIAGNDVTESIQSKIEDIRKINNEIEQLYKKIDKVSELTTKMMVTAPSDGMVSYVMYREGDTIEASDSSDQWSLQLLDMYNTNEMYIYTTVSDLDVLYISQDAPVIVTVDALPGETFDGVVTHLNQYTDRDGKTVYNVQIKVEGREGLRPGMNTNCFVDSGESLDTLLVPIEAVFEENGKQKVEVLTEGNEVEIVEIEVGLMNDMFVEVLSGLEEGQLVVTGSTKDLMPSQSVPENDAILPINNQ
ncbi:efflux RND transporter periplasmic adaptor subunit [Sedimentibacter hydroxybenzoicus DSM 7310]|uniref:Efflux RND transporter periplasmic adaptor subunit n=1 Tax=Sedimentibacter hydroxybenzoicus DSM 7310 TaxID=1123245 RepID=A0A974BJR8_SEDHY|nr:efflux RND transporter periplasmic adaptor subunit [Sedimentibacter hydroxybenzoicus]NYB74042.1 efflux RND transporter periplasmic adaptor subunit [Sedimentibacter hydroxybenzoicus DSM 7310]